MVVLILLLLLLLLITTPTEVTSKYGPDALQPYLMHNTTDHLLLLLLLLLLSQDPTEVINKYGADALRLYLINSPVVRAETLRFKEEGVFSVVKDVFLPWYNAYRYKTCAYNSFAYVSGSRSCLLALHMGDCGQCGQECQALPVVVPSQLY